LHLIASDRHPQIQGRKIDLYEGVQEMPLIALIAFDCLNCHLPPARSQVMKIDLYEGVKEMSDYLTSVEFQYDAALMLLFFRLFIKVHCP